MTATTQAEKKHLPYCAIYRPSTPSGCMWVCDCHMKRIRVVRVDNTHNAACEQFLDLIGPNEPVDGYSKDLNRSVRPAARNEVRDELRAKIEAWAVGGA